MITFHFVDVNVSSNIIMIITVISLMLISFFAGSGVSFSSFWTILCILLIIHA